MRPKDASAILALWNAANASVSVTDTIEAIRGMATRAHVAFLVVIVDGKMAGSIIATFDGWRGNMYRLVTHPDYRRRGIARALVREGERLLRHWGATRITALVERDHPWAVEFWEAAGYVLDHRMFRYVRNLRPIRRNRRSKEVER